MKLAVAATALICMSAHGQSICVRPSPTATIECGKVIRSNLDRQACILAVKDDIAQLDEWSNCVTQEAAEKTGVEVDRLEKEIVKVRRQQNDGAESLRSRAATLRQNILNWLDFITLR